MLDKSSAALLELVKHDIAREGDKWTRSRSGPHWSVLIRYVKLFDLVNRLLQRIAALEATITKVREIENATNQIRGTIEDFAAHFGVALNEIAEVVNNVIPLPPAEPNP